MIPACHLTVYVQPYQEAERWAIITKHLFLFDILLSSNEDLVENVHETQRDGCLTKWAVSCYNENCTDFGAR